MIRRHLSRGVTLVSAIFLLVVLSGLGIALVSLSTSQEKASSLDLLGVQAYMAARSGLEWGLFQALQNGGACAASQTFQVPVGAPSTFSVTVQCQTVTPEQFGIVRRTVTATACNVNGACPTNSSDPDYVQRVLTAEF